MRWILALVWVISVALVLPYMAYITHVDLSVSAAIQGPLKKWTEHSQKLHLLKIHSREGGSFYTTGLDGG